MKAFEIDQPTKQALAEISATFGVKYEIVKEVWEYTIFSMMLGVAEKPDGRVRINVPFIGSIGIKNRGETVREDGKLEPDLEAFVALSDSFKRLWTKVSKGSFEELSEYQQKVFISKVVDNMN